MAAKRMWLVASLLFVVATGAVRGAARQDQKTFRAETDLVRVTATVLDRDGVATSSPPRRPTGSGTRSTTRPAAP